MVSSKAAMSAVLLDCKLSFVSNVVSEEPISAEIGQIKCRRKKLEPPEPSATHVKPPLPRRKPTAGESVPQSARTSRARSSVSDTGPCAASTALQVYPTSQEHPEVLPSVGTVVSDVSRSDPAQTVYPPPSRWVDSVYHPA